MLRSQQARRVVCAMVWMVLLVPAIATTQTVCPVCGESFENTDECPNDGTNLKLLGVTPKTEEKPEEEPTTPDASDAPPGEENDSDTVQENGPVKYRRHDRGTAPAPGEAAPKKYSDRRSRIVRERIGPSDTEKKKPEPQKEQESLQEKDKLLRSEFERKRTYLWNQRQMTHLAEKRVRLDRSAAREKLIESLGAPLTSLGMRLFWMDEGASTGTVSAAEIDLNLARYRLRAGFSTLIGIRNLDHRDDLVFLEHVFAGFQSPARFSPFIIARGGIGVLASQRFGENNVYLITSVGAEVGLDSWITPWISISPSLGYVHCTVRDAYWNSFTFKLAVGF